MDGWTAVGIPSSTHPDDDNANAAIPSRALFILPPSSESQIIHRIPLLELAAVDIQSEAKASMRCDRVAAFRFPCLACLQKVTKVHPRASLPIRERDRIGEKKEKRQRQDRLAQGPLGLKQAAQFCLTITMAHPGTAGFSSHGRSIRWCHCSPIAS